MTRPRDLVLLTLISTAGLPLFLYAQDQPPESVASVAAPATPPSPEKEPAIAKLRRRVDESGLVQRFTSGDGWYPKMGGLITGSGIAGGAGYRTHLPLKLFADASGVISTRNYKGVDAKLRWLDLAHERLELWTTFQYRDNREQDFYGIGESSLRTHTNFAMQTADLAARIDGRITRWLRGRIDIGRIAPEIARGSNHELPSMHDVFSDNDVPGLLRQPTFHYRQASLDADYRDQPGRPHRGGYLRASFGVWEDRDLEQFDFRRFDGEAAHFLPIAPRHVVALHLGLTYTNNAPGQRVPFYFQPYVGGASTLRGYSEFRFVDENAIQITAEYRWALKKYLELAAFIDGANVQRDRQDIVPWGLKTSYGAGIRATTDSRVLARVDIGAGGDDGLRLFVKFGQNF